jgi:hypothetical protein
MLIKTQEGYHHYFELAKKWNLFITWGVLNAENQKTPVSDERRFTGDMIIKR